MSELTREELIETIKTDAFDPDGWMSDAQQANLEWIEDGHAIYFLGEGSIDVGHLVSLVLAVFEKAQAPTDHVKEAIYDGAEFVCVTCPRNSYGAQVAWEHAHPDEREDLARAIYSKIAFKGGNDEHYESVRGYMYHEAADAVLAAGFRRTAQTEPTDDERLETNPF